MYLLPRRESENRRRTHRAQSPHTISAPAAFADSENNATSDVVISDDVTSDDVKMPRCAIRVTADNEVGVVETTRYCPTRDTGQSNNGLSPVSATSASGARRRAEDKRSNRLRESKTKPEMEKQKTLEAASKFVSDVIRRKVCKEIL